MSAAGKRFTDLSDLGKLLPDGPEPPAAPKGHDGKGRTVRLSLDKKGRKGKSVTLISGLQHNPHTLEDIARILKQFCGTGGTVKEGTIEIQGDQRERVALKLREMNYTVR
jgi:translation initiation factor 1